MSKKNDVLKPLKLIKETYPLEDFFSFNINKYSELLKSKDEDFWIKEGQQKALRLFKKASTDVPAYKDFLKKRKINPKSVRTIKDFKKIPITTKKNYITKYLLSDRCWNGTLEHQNLIAVSSGTTGKPTMWPRGSFQEFYSVITHELLFSELYEINKYKTLAIIGFPMGIYISGIATTLPGWILATKYSNLTILTVGNNKDILLNIAKQLYKEYEQILLIGHPFFIKDVIETGKKYKINWKKIKIRMMFCSEGFNEIWRSYLAKQSSSDENKDIFNTYGSSEMLLMGHETPESIKIKQIAEKNKNIREKIFKTKTVPNIFQYNPLINFIESIDNELIFTAQSGIPLIRFNLRDTGNIVSINDVRKNLPKKLKKNWNLPLVTLYGKSNNAIVFYAVNIYPDNIHQALDNKLFLNKITGKFTMEKKYFKNMDQYLNIYVELKEGEKNNKKLAKNIQVKVVSTLKKVNLEYADASSKINKNLSPKIILKSYQDKIYFKPGLKPKYIM